VLIFLDASDPPDGKPLAEPARDAFLSAAEHVRTTLREPGTLYPDSFEFQARLVLSVADKFHPFGVDYARRSALFAALSMSPTIRNQVQLRGRSGCLAGARRQTQKVILCPRPNTSVSWIA